MSRTIPWEQATQISIAPKINLEVDLPVSKEETIEEIKSTHLGCLDARDINYYAAESGLEPNEVRRMMIQPNSEDGYENFMSIMHSFDEDETDSFIDYW